MSIVQSVMAVIILAIAGVSVAYPVLSNSTGSLTSPNANNQTIATGTDASIVNNIPTIFLLGLFITIASSTI